MRSSSIGFRVESKAFRPDIAGLRAIAVLSVVLCHFKIHALAGGFVGVDVFFVISGYLITKNIMSDLNEGRFSIATFYLSRARRIIPALFVTVAISFLIGMLWLAPGQFRALAKESTHALLSISNIQYWRESNEYFATAAEQLPLLHCWSLSLEEQFYLIWPAMLLLAVRVNRLLGVIVLAAVASFVMSLIVLRSDPQAAFFMMPFRIYEFSIGALVIFAERRFVVTNFVTSVLRVVGLLAIGLSVVWYDETIVFPGFAALLPALGTAVVIWAGHATKAPWLLANRFSQGIGAISYSLYLCHWPVMYFVRYIFGPDVFSPWVIALLLLLMVCLAATMFRFVEQPFRHTTTTVNDSQKRRDLTRYAVSILIFVAITHIAFRMDGWAWRLPAAAAERTELLKFGMSPCLPPDEPCIFGEANGSPGVELVGDSLSHQYVAAFDPLLKQLKMRGITSTMGGCPMLVGITPNRTDGIDCVKTREVVFARVLSGQSSIFFAQAWNLYSDTKVTSQFARPDLPSGEQRSIIEMEASLDATMALFVKAGKRVLLLGENITASCPIDRARMAPGPLWHRPQKPCRERTRSEVENMGRPINQMLRRVAMKWPDNISLMLPVDFFCTDTCPVSSNGVSRYFDGGHLSVLGAREIGARADAVFRKLLGTTTATLP